MRQKNGIYDKKTFFTFKAEHFQHHFSIVASISTVNSIPKSEPDQNLQFLNKMNLFSVSVIELSYFCEKAYSTVETLFRDTLLKRYSAALFFLCILPWLVVSAEAVKDSSDPFSGTLSTTGNILGYVNNLEYDNAHREGFTYCGGVTNLRLNWRPHDRFDFSLGGHFRKAYGDKKYLSGARPIIGVRYNRNHFFLNIGELESKAQHTMPDAIINEQYEYDPAIEEGFQLGCRSTILNTDLWLAIDQLNTLDNREHLLIGNNSSLTLGKLMIRGTLLWNHFGGQLPAPDGDFVRDNINGSGGLKYAHPLSGKVSSLGAEVYALASSVTPDRNNVPAEYGWGIYSRIWFVFIGLETSLMAYKGNDYKTWLGNPMYETNRPYYYLELKRHTDFRNNTFLDVGFRFDFIETSLDTYFNHTEHQFWIRMGCNWDRKLIGR